MTPALQLSKEQVELLDPADVEAYLVAHDWQEDAAASTTKVGAFHYRPLSDVTVLVPRDRAFLDYALRVGDVLQTLAVIERRKVWAVLDDVLVQRQAPSRNGAGDGQKGSRSRR